MQKIDLTERVGCSTVPAINTIGGCSLAVETRAQCTAKINQALKATGYRTLTEEQFTQASQKAQAVYF